MELQGIDVSRHQGLIDWRRVKNFGIAFAFIRAGYCNYEGRLIEDKRFQENMTNAALNGVPTGVYVYSYAVSEQSSAEAARQTLELVRLHNPVYPIVFDIEDKVNDNLTAKQNTAIANSFLSVIEQGGYRPMLYTYLSFANHKLCMRELERYDLWIAHYSKRCGYQGDYKIWQYSGSGKVDGIDTPVDLDVAYCDYAAGRVQGGPVK